MSASAVVMTSGGLDSTVLLYWVLSKGYRAIPLFIDYGQHCAVTELESLNAVAPRSICGEVNKLDVSGVFKKSPSRLIREANLWSDSISSDDIMLPYRNLFLLSAGAAFAASCESNILFSAFINSNHAREIDATNAFLTGVERLIGDTGGVRLEMPFRLFSKKEVVQLGLSLDVPMGRTFSCQVNAKEHCGACPNCVERLGAFAAVGGARD